jgi:hypothetical protein
VITETTTATEDTTEVKPHSYYSFSSYPPRAVSIFRDITFAIIDASSNEELPISSTLWIGFGFLAALVVFLGVTIYLPPKDNTGRATLKFLTALSAGFSGGFFTGDALFKYQQQIGGGVFGVSGTAGCALFFTVWFVYPKVFRLDDAINLDVPANWTFRNTVETVAGAPCEYDGFNSEELQAPTRASKVSAQTPSEAIRQVRLITAVVNAVRPYEVQKGQSAYRLIIKAGG